MMFIKCLIPMRMLIFYEKIKDVFLVILKSMNEISTSLFLVIIMILIFAIFGIEIFRNRFGYCEFPLNFGINENQVYKNFKNIKKKFKKNVKF